MTQCLSYSRFRETLVILDAHFFKSNFTTIGTAICTVCELLIKKSAVYVTYVVHMYVLAI